jgi:hypothetical protein
MTGGRSTNTYVFMCSILFFMSNIENNTNVDGRKKMAAEPKKKTKKFVCPTKL